MRKIMNKEERSILDLFRERLIPTEKTYLKLEIYEILNLISRDLYEIIGKKKKGILISRGKFIDYQLTKEDDSKIASAREYLSLLECPYNPIDCADIASPVSDLLYYNFGMENFKNYEINRHLYTTKSCRLVFMVKQNYLPYWDEMLSRIERKFVKFYKKFVKSIIKEETYE
jgi:hypothetical protein